MKITGADFRMKLLLLVSCFMVSAAINDQPILGILTQESRVETKHYGDTYFYSAYVEYLQMAGARTIPIRVRENEDYYENIFNKINGVLFPGGDVDILTSDYAKAGRILFNLAKQANDKGDHFPLWGTCNGHGLFTAIVTNKEVLVPTDAEDYIIPLDLVSDVRESRMFKNAPEDVIKIISTWNVTANYHTRGLTPETYKENAALNKFFRVISTNVDKKRLEFISTMEAYDYPFYSTQWHPEMNIFRWETLRHVNHSAEAVKISQYLSNFFVNEARRSNHHYPDLQAEAAALMYNYEPVYVGLPSLAVYYFFNYTNKGVKTLQPHDNEVPGCSVHAYTLLCIVIMLQSLCIIMCTLYNFRIVSHHKHTQYRNFMIPVQGSLPEKTPLL